MRDCDFAIFFPPRYGTNAAASYTRGSAFFRLFIYSGRYAARTTPVRAIIRQSLFLRRTVFEIRINAAFSPLSGPCECSGRRTSRRKTADRWRHRTWTVVSTKRLLPCRPLFSRTVPNRPTSKEVRPHILRVKRCEIRTTLLGVVRPSVVERRDESNLVRSVFKSKNWKFKMSLRLLLVCPNFNGHRTSVGLLINNRDVSKYFYHF